VCVADAAGLVAIDLVEHLLAAFGGLGIRDGVGVRVEGPELPLLDGGARAFVDALQRLEAPPSPPTLVVAREGTLTHGRSSYRFTPGEGVSLGVAVAFREPVGAGEARWDGDPVDFAARIAPARTFGFVEEHAALLASGRARAVDPRAVVVFGPEGPLYDASLSGPDEPARHKLLDLTGDLALYGGPPRGEIFASWPGHAATHAIVREALASGLLERTRA
jgi:UDP-3-O-[3-hydroxymyristoyl] N-acetylglucosamine deacetylase